MLDTMLDADASLLAQIYFRPIGNSLGFVSSFKPSTYVKYLVSKTSDRATPVDRSLLTWTVSAAAALLALAILVAAILTREA